MFKKLALVMLVMSLMLSGCSQEETEDKAVEETVEATEVVATEAAATEVVAESNGEKIDAQKAKELIDANPEAIILDVRTQEEYDAGHIPNSVLLPHTDIESQGSTLLPDKDAMILIYCRSGNRSGQATQMLLQMGYTNIKDFGGIIDWPYEIEQ